ncbi:MAG TPA: MFS transporter [Chitinophagaceae bacterium]|nr:MFS transporter [Chitinophagaceae bacterium]
MKGLNKGLIALAIGGLSIGMTEFSMMGVLPDLAADQGVSIPTAAHLIAFYALGVVVGAPILVLITGKFPPKKVLAVLMILFVVFNGLFAIAPSYTLLEVSRFAAGLPHGAFFGVGSVVATSLAKKGREARAISVMFAGLTLANVVGVPLGTFVGHHYSWRFTYGIVCFLGLMTLLSIFFWMPDIPKAKDGNLFGQLKYFSKKRSWLLIVVIAIGTGGLFAWISYIAPMVIQIGGVDPDRLPIIMVLAGLGMFIGNLFGGKLADTVGAAKAAIFCFLAMVLCLLTVHFTAQFYYLTYVMSFITGMISFSVGTPLQMMLINDAKGAETFAASAGQASFNIGNTLGSYLGGLPIVFGLAYNTPVLVGCGLAFTGAMLAVAFRRNLKQHVVAAG